MYLLLGVDHVRGTTDGVVDQRVEEADHGVDGMSQDLHFFLGCFPDLREPPCNLLGCIFHLLCELFDVDVLLGGEVLVDGSQRGLIQLSNVVGKFFDGIITFTLTW